MANIMLRQMIANAVAALGLGGLFPTAAQRGERDIARHYLRQQRRRGRIGPREPSGLSVRSLRRAVNAGWEPEQPTIAQKKRHDWFHRPLAAKS